MEGIKRAMNERNLNEGQWEDRKQWSLGVGQRRKKFELDVYIHTVSATLSQLFSLSGLFSGSVGTKILMRRWKQVIITRRRIPLF